MSKEIELNLPGWEKSHWVIESSGKTSLYLTGLPKKSEKVLLSSSYVTQTVDIKTNENGFSEIVIDPLFINAPGAIEIKPSPLKKDEPKIIPITDSVSRSEAHWTEDLSKVELMFFNNSLSKIPVQIFRDRDNGSREIFFSGDMISGNQTVNLTKIEPGQELYVWVGGNSPEKFKIPSIKK